MDKVEVPITLIQAQLKVVVLQEAPKILREDVGQADSTVGDLVLLQPEHVQTTDLLLVTRKGQWSRNMPLSTLLSMAGGGGGGGGASGLGEDQLDPTLGAGGNTVQLGDRAAYIYSASPVPVLNMRLPAVFRDGQECLVAFGQRVQTLNLVATGTDGGITVTCSSLNLPTRAIQKGTMMLLRYNRGTSPLWGDHQWHIVGISGKEDPPEWSPVRDFNAKFDGVTLDTAAVQATWTAAKKVLAGFNYGQGGLVRHTPGVALVGALSLSRWVSLSCDGALGSHVLRADYSDRAGLPGEDAQITFLDDGTGQAGITAQNKITNLAMDGRRSTIEGIGNPLRSHIRHGIYLPEVVDGTDRVFTAQDLQVMYFPGDGLHIVNNDQIRGGNLKFTNNRRGFYCERVKDGKIDEVGSGANGPGTNTAIDPDLLLAANVFLNCASLKIGKVDVWTSALSAAIPLLIWISCAKMLIGEGEAEGMCVIVGDNNDTGSKAYRQLSANTFQSLNIKVSSDMYAAYLAAGRTANVLTGAGYVAHLKIIDANGNAVPNGSFCYKLGQPNDGNGNIVVSLPETPKVGFWFGTQIDPGDSQYADWLKASGDLDVTGFKLTWFEGKDSPGGRRSRSIYPFVEHIANLAHKLRGLRLGTVTLRVVGTQMEDELPLDGAQWTTQYDKGLFYLRTDPNWASTDYTVKRKLTDRDLTGPGADPATGYVTFNAPNWSAEATRLSTLLGVTVQFYMVYKQ